MLVRALAAELSPAERRTWLAELQRLSVPAAVAKIRAVLGTDADTTGAAPPNDRRNAAEPPLGATGEAIQLPRAATDALDLTAAAPRCAMDNQDTQMLSPGFEMVQDTQFTQVPRDVKVMHDVLAHRDTQVIQGARNAQALRDAEVTNGAPAAQATVLHDVEAPGDIHASQHATQSAPAKPDTPSNPDLATKPQPIDDLIAAIRCAAERGASAEVRNSGAAACRAILTALDAQVGQSLASASATAPSPPLASLLSLLAAMPREQLIEFLVNRLRSARPLGTPTQITAGPRYHTIPIPRVNG